MALTNYYLNYYENYRRLNKMNKHLNLFRFYSEDDSNERLENNLTRGLALTLKYEPIFLDRFITLVDPSYQSSIIPIQSDPYFDISIQRQTQTISGSGRIIAVALTASALEYTEEQFQNTPERETKTPQVDMVIQYANTTILFEIKRNEENCIAQLKNQVSRYKEHLDTESDSDVEFEETIFTSLSWQDCLKQLTKTTNFLNSMQNSSPILNDYLELVVSHYPHWQPIPKLTEINSSTKDTEYLIEERLMAEFKNMSRLEYMNMSTRNSFQLGWHIASELRFIPQTENGLTEVRVKFWAGDTKRQGNFLFKNNTADMLLSMQHLECDTHKLEVQTYPYLKFSSFQKGIVWLDKIDNINKYNSESFNLIA